VDIDGLIPLAYNLKTLEIPETMRPELEYSQEGGPANEKDVGFLAVLWRTRQPRATVNLQIEI
jgi:hypothetical protein